MLSTKNIAVRFEGGVGDHILAARFIPAIREKYPGCRITIFSDTDGNTIQTDFLIALWPRLAEDYVVMDGKANKEYLIKHQYAAAENYPAAIENMADKYKEKIKTFDIFYDLHIDGLKWLDYDFDWSKYFYSFPKPSFELSPLVPEEDYIVVNLFVDMKTHQMEDWYNERLLKELSSKYKVYAATTEKNKANYEKYAQYVTPITASIRGVTKLIANAKLFITLDSGLKYIGYCTNTPTINYCNMVRQYGEVPQHQVIRWQPFPFSVMPQNYPINKVLDLSAFCIKYKTNILPECDFDSVFVKRNYTPCTNQ